MRGLFGGIADGIESKTTDISALSWEKLLGTPSSKAGVSVNIDTSLKVTTVLAAARVLMNGVAQIPLKLYEEKPDGSKVPAKKHPVYKLLWRRPNEWQTSFEFRQVMMLHAVLQNNAYAWIGRGGTRRQVVEIIPLCGKVVPKQADDYTLTYEVHDRHGVVGTYPREQIMHLRGPSWNGIAGLDAIQLAREAIGLAIATEETHAKLHSQGARPGGLISVEGELKSPARARLRAALEERVEGLQNAFKTLVLDQNAKWFPFAMSGVDSQHLETRRFQIEEICRALGVFPQMVGYADKTATFASAEAFFLAHVVHSLQPWIENWEQVLARDLFPDEDNLVAKFSVQGLLRGDNKARAELYATGIVNGWLTRNEARGFEELNPLPGLWEPLVPLNMGTQGERDAMAKEVTRAVKDMMGGNGGPQFSDDELEVNVKSAIASWNAQRRMPVADPEAFLL